MWLRLTHFLLISKHAKVIKYLIIIQKYLMQYHTKLEANIITQYNNIHLIPTWSDFYLTAY